MNLWVDRIVGMGVGKGTLGIWHFTIKFLAKKAIFLVLSG